MKAGEVEQIMNLVKSVFSLTDFPEHEKRLREKLSQLKLKKETPKIDTNQSRYIERARQWAAEFSKKYGQVTVEDVLINIPPPDGMSKRVIGGIFRGQMWERIGERTVATPNEPNRAFKIIGVFRLAGTSPPRITDWTNEWD
jgi:hypothetical protein|tara:strand:+ start:823 stop:1248 length:426 start_codon:yes stop_codon:yes gene_type:complete